MGLSDNIFDFCRSVTVTQAGLGQKHFSNCLDLFEDRLKYEDESNRDVQYCVAFLGLIRIKLKLNMPILLNDFCTLQYIKMERTVPADLYEGGFPPLRYLENGTVGLLSETRQLRALYNWRSIRRLVILRQIMFYWMELPARCTTRELDHKRARDEYERM